MKHADVEIYRNAAEKYRPDQIELLLIAESPPWFSEKSKMSYFYFENCPGNEMFFATIVKAVLGKCYRKSEGTDKRELLCNLKNENIWLMDAVEYPINKDANGINISNKNRQAIIRQNIQYLKDRLKALQDRGIITRSTRIVLIKETVYDAIGTELIKARFRVLNKKHIGFPRYQFDPDVVVAIKDLCKRSGFLVT